MAWCPQGCSGGHVWEGAEDVAVPAQKLRDSSVSVLVMGMGPVLREALWGVTGPWDSLVHLAAYADLRHHQDMFIEWICRGEWGAIHTLGAASKGGPQPEPSCTSLQGQQLNPTARRFPHAGLYVKCHTHTKLCRRHAQLAPFDI